MNSIDNDVFSDRCNVPLFLFSESIKLAVLVALGIGLLHLAPALDDAVIQAKQQSIPSSFVTSQIASFDQTSSR
ncbi:hypothetical protein [Pseudovibrio sp. Tun.PSC04-5.I4]|uniref:hypothetical protein n=1 Tax=Pseudovibrio sp. Tun.PSC04-5.I4 TaxID=1798213 RepID=UPI00087E77ED|nr:hypothetical protein [Pseudovibrio sp. Tun.PSC04-5.I4]SDR11140.1 hypothetical protein SAMN04515695_2824 [Pseudovibrio sp. Tun.PSC04-5.I4]SDR34919.1 hypothetical protein SAMN04515695_4794 [Pseudovibrio sp. Tun.PSC04-5.I4]